jgi:hypothetical protein
MAEGGTMEPVEEVEMMCRSILQRAGAREYTMSQSAPEVQSVDFKSGYAEGQLTGQLTTAALMLGLLKGESPSKILDDARAQAKVDNAFPFDLHMQGVSDDGLPGGMTEVTDVTAPPEEPGLNKPEAGPA